MPRNNKNNNQDVLLDNALRAAIKKQDQCRQNISENHGLSIAAAGRLVEVEKILLDIVRKDGDNGGVISEEEVTTFCEKQRRRLVDIARRNVANERDVESFVTAATQLRQQEMQKKQNAAAASAQRRQQQQQHHDGEEEEQDGGGAEQEADDESTDYGAVLTDLFQKDKTARQADTNNPIDGQQYVRQIQKELGEEQVDPSGGAAGGGGGDDDDDEIHVMNDTLASQAHNLICPITTTLMENPVKNSVCGHHYSKAGIMGIIASRRRQRRQCACPVAGCSNKNVTESQLLDNDTYLKTAVRRERRRLEAEAQNRASQAASVDDDDDDEEEML